MHLKMKIHKNINNERNSVASQDSPKPSFQTADVVQRNYFHFVDIEEVHHDEI